MKLNNGDRIKYNDSIYTVAAVLFSTVYLRTAIDNSTDFDYTAKEVYKHYRNIEILE